MYPHTHTVNSQAIYLSLTMIIYRVMTTLGTGRMISAGRANTKYITIPSAVVGDSQFPFEEGEEVTVLIDVSSQCLVISKKE